VQIQQGAPPNRSVVQQQNSALIRRTTRVQILPEQPVNISKGPTDRCSGSAEESPDITGDHAACKCGQASLDGKCHREYTAHIKWARVKKRGKSSLGSRAIGNSGKPHGMQGKAGTKTTPVGYRRITKFRVLAASKYGQAYVSETNDQMGKKRPTESGL
jgi:hypothetical protein